VNIEDHHVGLLGEALSAEADEDYFENLLAVWTHHGRQPKYGEMNLAPSSIPIGAYEHKWGTGRKALLAFLERVNSDTQQEETEPIPDVQEPRAPPVSRRRLGLRRVKEKA
jgi:hypothetical protein